MKQDILSSCGIRLWQQQGMSVGERVQWRLALRLCWWPGSCNEGWHLLLRDDPPFCIHHYKRHILEAWQCDASLATSSHCQWLTATTQSQPWGCKGLTSNSLLHCCTGPWAGLQQACWIKSW